MRFHVAVVCFDRVDDLFGLLVLAGKVNADGHVASLNLVVDGLAEVMQQAGTLGRGNVHAELGSEQTGDLGDLDRVVEHVLAVARAVALAAEELDEIGVQAVDIRLKYGALALFLDGLVDLALRLGDHFLDAGGVDAAVLNELFERETRNLTADGVKARDRDGLRRIVDDEIAAGERFDGTDVASLAADDAALHFVVGERNDGNGDLARVVGGAALDGCGDKLAGLLLGFVLELRFHFLDLGGHFVRAVSLDALDEVLLGFLHGVAGDLFQHIELALLDEPDLLLLGIGFLELAVEDIGLLFERFGLAVEIFFLLLETALLLGNFVAALFHFAVALGACAVDLFLRFEQRLALFVFSGFNAFVDDALRFILGAGDLALGNLFPVHDAQHKADQQKHQHGNDAGGDHPYGHLRHKSVYLLLP